ncbi:putative ribonuclease H-like domain-containing protein [Tanacetum coccineum]
MQKAVIKQQFEAFKISNSKVRKGDITDSNSYLSQLKLMVRKYNCNANQSFLRSLPPASSCTPSTSSTNIPEKEVLAGFADEVIYSLFAKQTEDLDLLHEDLEQIDDVDIEEMDLNLQIFNDCYSNEEGTHDGKKKIDSLYQQQETGKQEKNQMGLLTMDDGIVNWGEHTEAEETNHALMAISSSNEILLKVPRHHNMYSFDMKTPSPAKGFACLIAKATSDESKLWHRRLGHINFKNLNKLVKGNLVRGLPSKVFKNDHTCVACHKGKQLNGLLLRPKLERLITVAIHTLHMDLFGPTSVKSINHELLPIENQLSHRVKIIRSDNGTEFKNRNMLEFCGNKGIKQEYSTARTPQQNGVAERMNRTLIEAARTMRWGIAVFLTTTFWAEKQFSTACYIFYRITLSVLGKFDGKILGYRWMFDIDYLSDSMNYIPVSLENQANPHAGVSEVTNSAGTPNSIASEEKDEEVELIVVPTAIKFPEEKDESRTSSINSKKEETLTEPQQEKKDSSTKSLEDNPKIHAFRS